LLDSAATRAESIVGAMRELLTVHDGGESGPNAGPRDRVKPSIRTGGIMIVASILTCRLSQLGQENE